MSLYLFATGHEWGVEVYRHVSRGSWFGSIVTSQADLPFALKIEKPKIVFFLNWSQKVPAEVTSRYRCVNFHCTELPYGRGGHPIENLILRGHTETVITAHVMTEAIDAGAIYDSRGPVSLAGSKDEILSRFVFPCVDLIEMIVTENPKPIPQNGDVVTFKRLPKEEYDRFWKGRS